MSIVYDKSQGRIVESAILHSLKIRDMDIPSSFIGTAPLKVYFDNTYLCNLACKHCITNSSPHVETSNELDTDRVINIINELSSIGVLEIAIGGGEPFANKDWFEIFSSVVNSGMNLIVTTNGILLRSNEINKLKIISPLEVRVSLDGYKDIHDEIRGSGTYSSTIKTIESSIEQGLNITVRLTISSRSENNIDELFKDLSVIGVKAIKVAVTKNAGRARDSGGNIYVWKNNTTTLKNTLFTLAEKFGLLIQLSEDDFEVNSMFINDPKLRSTEADHCGAGFETCYITPHGEVLGCVTIENISFGNVTKQSFLDCWVNTISSKYRVESSKSPSRRLCDHLCNNCSKGQ